jgi:hypothetical protein
MKQVDTQSSFSIEIIMRVVMLDTHRGSIARTDMSPGANGEHCNP